MSWSDAIGWAMILTFLLFVGYVVVTRWYIFNKAVLFVGIVGTLAALIKILGG